MTTYTDLLNQPYDWQPVPGTDDLMVSRRGDLIRFSADGSRKKVKSAIVDGIQYQARTIVAMVFVGNPNPEIFDTIISIDGDTSNISAKNLMWGTRAECRAYMVDNGFARYPRPRFIECVDDQTIFNTISEAAAAMDTTPWWIKASLHDGSALPNGKNIREFRGTERVIFWTSDPKTWAKHYKYSNYLVAPEGLVIKLDRDGGLGAPLRTYYRPSNTPLGNVWVKTDRKEDLKDIMRNTFGL